MQIGDKVVALRAKRNTYRKGFVAVVREVDRGMIRIEGHGWAGWASTWDFEVKPPETFKISVLIKMLMSRRRRHPLYVGHRDEIISRIRRYAKDCIPWAGRRPEVAQDMLCIRTFHEIQAKCTKGKVYTVAEVGDDVPFGGHIRIIADDNDKRFWVRLEHFTHLKFSVADLKTLIKSIPYEDNPNCHDALNHALEDINTYVERLKE